MPFVQPGLGYKAKLLLAKETTYDSPPLAAQAIIEVTQITITPKLSTIEDPSLTASTVSRRFIGQGGQSYECSFRFRVGYEGLVHLLRAYFPGYSSAAFDTTMTAHTFKEGIGLSPFSYTLDFVWGDVPTPGNVNRLSGAFGQSLRLTGQAGSGENAMLMGECVFVARTLAPNVSPMTGGTLATPLGVIYHQLLRTSGNFKDGTPLTFDAIQLRSFEFNVTHPFDVSRFLFGQVNAEAPVRNGFTEGTFVLEEEYTTPDMMNTAKNATATEVRVLFENPTVVGTTTGKRSLQIRGGSPTPSEYSSEVPGFGVITQRVTYQLAHNTTDQSFAVIVVTSMEPNLPA